MAKEPENLSPRILQDIQATLAEHTRILRDYTQRFDRIDEHLGDFFNLLRYSMGRTEELAFRQSQQESRINEISRELEKLRRDKQPTSKSGSNDRPSRLDLLIEQFEKMSPEERKRSIEYANEMLRTRGLKALEEKTD